MTACQTCSAGVPAAHLKTHLDYLRRHGEACPDCGNGTIEIRCLWQQTDYGYIGLLAAARGYGGRELGSYQDAITDERFARLRHEEAEINPEWRLVESVVKVPYVAIEALFTDGTEVEGDA